MMGGYRIVTVTPAGRRDFVKILAAYLLRERGLIDRHEWWLNTADKNDERFLEDLTAAYPDYFTLVRSSEPLAITHGERNRRINQWYHRACDEKTVYVKIDDDVCYFSENCLRQLLAFRIANPHPFIVYPCIVNNPCISHVLQRRGAVPYNEGICHYDPYGLGWRCGRFAERVHRSFIDAVSAGDLRKWQFDEFHLMEYERVSINCVAWLGVDFATFGGVVEGDDEHFLSCTKPAELRRPNVVFGQAVVAHFSFLPQIEYLQHTNLLAEYQALADRCLGSNEALCGGSL